MKNEMTVLALGTHVLDVLARPVETIPEGQGAALLEQIKASAAGTAGGTALSLAKLGAIVRSAGAIGTDALGDLLLSLLQRGGVDTTLLVRKDDVQTSASVLPIRPDGARPALHVIGANGAYTLDDVPWAALDEVTHLHFGAPEFLGGEAAAKIATHARERGVVCSADLLAPGEPGILAWIEPLLPLLDYLLPNDEQVLGLTGTTDLADGARKLVDAGVGCVVVTRGARGAIAVDANGVIEIPAFEVPVVDTSGCGDAFSAGFLRGVALGRPIDAAAVLGCATAALVAGGLGSDHGNFDLAAVDAFAASTPVLPL
jgi:sugar/nucleoside kinase (ribokinase family)